MPVTKTYDNQNILAIKWIIYETLISVQSPECTYDKCDMKYTVEKLLQFIFS